MSTYWATCILYANCMLATRTPPLPQTTITYAEFVCSYCTHMKHNKMPEHSLSMHRDVKSSDRPRPRGQKNSPWPRPCPRCQWPRPRPRDTAASASCRLASWSRLLQCIYSVLCRNCYCKVSYHENQGWQWGQKWTRPRKNCETMSSHTVLPHGISNLLCLSSSCAFILLIHFGLGLGLVALGLGLGLVYLWPR